MASLIIFTFLVYGLFMLFNINFKSISDQSLNYLIKEKNIPIRDRLRLMNGKKKENAVIKQIKKVNSLLELTNKKKDLPLIFMVSLILGLFGIGVCVSINNLYLLAVLPLALFMLPFVLFESSINAHKESSNAQLEIVLNIVTTSYLRTNDIIDSIKENLKFMEEPIKDYFIDFLNDTTKNPNIELGLKKLQNKIENKIFKEWCESVIACQSNYTMKATLIPIIKKFSDIRIINSELNMLFTVPKNNFIQVSIIVVLIVPLLAFINKEWYNIIFDTNSGKIALTILVAIVFFSIYSVSNIIKPIEE